MTIDSGAGNDTIQSYGANTTINAGDGDDDIRSRSNYSGGDSVTIDSGAGDDSIRNGTNYVTINAGEGNDTIKVGNTSVTRFAVESVGAGDVIELYRAVNSIEIKNGALVAGSVTISGITSMAGENDVWVVDGTQATLARTNSGGAKLGSDGKTITFEAPTGDEAEELFVLSGLKSGVTADELKANVTIDGTQVTVNENILGDDEVEISEGYTLALADTVTKSEEVSSAWQVNGTTATFTGEHFSEGYVLVDNVIVHREATEGETFTLTGVKKNLTKSALNANVTIDGETVTLNEKVLSDSDVTISDGRTLALASTVPQSEAAPDNWDISSAGDTSTAIYSGGGATEGYSLDDNKIVYTGSTGGTFTLTGLSKNFTSSNVSIDGNKVILSADALGKSNVTLTTDDDFTLALDEDCPTVTAVDKGWSLSGTTATYHDAGKFDGYKLTNSKTVTYVSPTGGKALLTVKGLAEGLTLADGAIDGLSIDDKTLTVTPAVVGENLSVSAGYKVVFDEGSYGDSKFTGTTGRDTIEVNGSGLIVEAGRGNDTITSSDGGNVYLFAATGGKDVVVGFGDDDTIKITDGSSVTASVKGNDIIIKAGSATMTLKDAATGKHVTVVDANDDTLIDQTFYADRIVVDNSATLTTTFNSKSFAATEEFPAVDGSAVSRAFSLTGGGENILTGGKGNDTFAAGNGSDIITDYGNGTDKISLTADISSFEVDGSDVILNFGSDSSTEDLANFDGSDKSLTIQNGAGKKINFIQSGKTTTEIFMTGGKLSSNSKSITLSSTAEVFDAGEVTTLVTIDGSLTDSVFITGNAQSNKIFGGEGSDTLNGGAKNATLTGGDGNDIFVCESGKNVVTDYVSGDDRISLGASPIGELLNSKGDVVLKFSSANQLTIKGGDEIVFVTDSGEVTKTYFSDRIVGSDCVTLQSNYKTDFTVDELPNVNASLTTAKIALNVNDSANEIIGGKGNKLIDGGADTFVYSSGDDTISDYESKDRISLTSAIESFDLDGDNVIIGFGSSSLTISDAANSSITFVEEVNGKVTTSVNVFASEGIFNGKRTAVTLNGGGGKDSLWGGAGSDTFIYSSGGGNDVIFGFGDGDALQIEGKFTASVVGENISFKVGSVTKAITLKDVADVDIVVNGETYRISGNNFVK